MDGELLSMSALEATGQQLPAQTNGRDTLSGPTQCKGLRHKNNPRSLLWNRNQGNGLLNCFPTEPCTEGTPSFPPFPPGIFESLTYKASVISPHPCPSSQLFNSCLRHETNKSGDVCEPVLYIP